MKSKATKEKALALYISGISISSISKVTKTGLRTIRTWKTKYDWQEAREKAIQKGVEKSPEIYASIIKEQVEITKLAHKELFEKLKHQPEIRKLLKDLDKRFGEIGKLQKDEFLQYVSAMQELYKQLMYDQSLIKIMIHGLEVIRPKVSQTNLNITDQKILVQWKE